MAKQRNEKIENSKLEIFVRFVVFVVKNSILVLVATAFLSVLHG